MPSKSELRDELAAAGITPPASATKAELEALLTESAAARRTSPAADSAPDPPAAVGLSQLNARRRALGRDTTRTRTYRFTPADPVIDTATGDA